MDVREMTALERATTAELAEEIMRRHPVALVAWVERRGETETDWYAHKGNAHGLSDLTYGLACHIGQVVDRHRFKLGE
jgi:hypothetical protein